MVDQKSKKEYLTNGIEFGVRFYACVLFCVYGLGKAVQFGKGSNVAPELMAGQEFTGQQIMWIFFGYSLIYPIFIGVFQIIGGALLLFERTKLLGVLILLPIVSNIIIMDFIYDVQFGATINALTLLAALLFICYWERKKIAEIILIIIKKTKILPNRDKAVQIGIGVLFAFLVFYLVRVLGDLLIPNSY